MNPTLQEALDHVVRAGLVSKFGTVYVSNLWIEGGRDDRFLRDVLEYYALSKRAFVMQLIDPAPPEVHAPPYTAQVKWNGKEESFEAATPTLALYGAMVAVGLLSP